jgi:isocitrate/isopropylmalate dehydrogenase
MRRLLVLPGDGIGPVVIDEALRVLAAVGAPAPERLEFGLGCWERTGEVLPAATLLLVREVGCALLGAATTPSVGPSSPILGLRRALDLDLWVRPAPGLGIVVVCHTFAGLYGAAEEDRGDAAVAQQVLTAAQADRLVAEACRRATRRVTIVDKPTVFRASARLFEAALARHNRPHLQVELINADAFVAALVRDPTAFDIIAATSFVGDIVSDLVAALDGGLPLAASMSLGSACAVFEPVHGSAPRHAGVVPSRMNPIGAIRAAALWLRHVGEEGKADRVEGAVVQVLAEGRVRTPDLGGQATTREVGEAVVAALGAAAVG